MFKSAYWSRSGFQLIGAIDDWVKLAYDASRGLSVKQKLHRADLRSHLIAGWWLFNEQLDQAARDWTFSGRLGNYGLTLGSAIILSGAPLVLVGSSNGVNLTDGLDGLASGCMIFCRYRVRRP